MESNEHRCSCKDFPGADEFCMAHKVPYELVIPKSPPTVAEVMRAEAITLIKTDGFVEITNELEYAHVAEVLKQVKGTTKRISEYVIALKQPHKDKIDEITDEWRTIIRELAATEVDLKASLVTYSDAMEAKRREEQRLADEAARKEQERLRKRAEKELAAGNAEKAIGLQERAEAIVAPVSQTRAPKVSGLNMRETYQVVVENPDLVPNTYKSVDTAKLQRVVSAARGQIDIPGVRIIVQRGAASTSR